MEVTKNKIIDMIRMLNINISPDDIKNCISMKDIELIEELEFLWGQEDKVYLEFISKHINKIDLEKLKFIFYLKIKELLENSDFIAISLMQDPNLKKSIEQIEKEVKNNNISIYYLLSNDGDTFIVEYRNGIIKKNNDSRNSKNYKKMKQIDDEIGLPNVIQSLILTDLRDLICNEQWLAELIRAVILRNSYREKVKDEGDSYDPDKNDFSDLGLIDYIAAFKDNMLKWAHKMNIEKMLLTSAYRYIEFLENNSGDEKIADKKTVDRMELILEYIYDKIKNLKIRISGEGEDQITGERIQIKYDVRDLKEDLKRFTKDGYISKARQSEIKDGILNGKITLESISEEPYFSLIKLSQEDKKKIIESSEANFLWYINKNNMSEETIISFLDRPEYSFEFIESLLNSNKIGELTINFLYESSKMSRDTRKRLGAEIIGEYISEDTIIREFENGKQNINKLLGLYIDGVLTKDIVNLLIDEYDLDKEIIDKFINEDLIEFEELKNLELNIDLDEVVKIIRKEQDKKNKNEASKEDEKAEQIDEEKLAKAKSLVAYMINREEISDEILDDLYKDGIINEKDLLEFAKKSYFTEDIISKLYLRSLISKETLEKLVELNSITKEKFEEITSKLDKKQLLKNAEQTGLDLNSIKIILPSDKPGNYAHTNNLPPNLDSNSKPKHKVVIDPFAREHLIYALGGKIIERREYDKESPFNNYEFYLISDGQDDISAESIVIAERYYIDRLSDEKRLIPENATYLFRLGDLLNIGKKSKQEVNDIMFNGSKKSVTKINHRIKTSKENPRGWATKLTEKVNEWKERKEYKTAKDEEWINSLITNIDGVVDNRTDEWVRIFDLDSVTGEGIDDEGR